MLLNHSVKAALLLTSCLASLAPARSLSKPVRDLSTRALTTTSSNIQAVEATDDRYPRVTQLSDGSLLLGYMQADDSGLLIQIMRSTDGGTTFVPYGSVARRESTADLDNTFLLEVGTTSPPTVLAAFRNHDKNDDGAYTWFRITVCKSINGGKDWVYASQAVEFSAESTGGLGIWEPFMRIGNDGKIQLTYSQELTTANQVTLQTISDDGSSWSTPVNLNVHDAGVSVRDGMQSIVKVTDQVDGREALVMVFETTSRAEHMFDVEYAVSYDDGATYTEKGVVYMPPDGKQAGGPQVVKIGDNGLAVLFMTDESTPTTNWPTVAEIKSITSDGLKGGKITWSAETALVGETDSHWPGLLNFNGTVFGVYDHAGGIVGKFLNY